MLRETLSIALAFALLAPAPGAAAQSGRKPSIKEQLIDIPTGSIVEVRTKAKQKYYGRLGEATNESFSVQQIKNEKLETVNLSFQDVKSVKIKASTDGRGPKAAKTAGWIVLGGLAALGVLTAVGIGIALAGGY